MKRAPVTAVVLTKNEAAGIARCLEALSFCDQVIVVDSRSHDGTTDIARSRGAEVLEFDWNGRYPKKKQWGMQHPLVRNSWVLHLDADEIVTRELASEIVHRLSLTAGSDINAFDIPLEYHFAGKKLRHGHRVVKRALVNKHHSHFPEVDDLEAPGITEVEGHYQPVVEGRTDSLTARLVHDDPDPLSSWVSRHNRYSDWEAYLRHHRKARAAVRKNRSTQGRLFEATPFKPLAFFMYSYVIRLGFLDGRAGFDYSFGLTWYYWLTAAKSREFNRSTQKTEWVDF